MPCALYNSGYNSKDIKEIICLFQSGLKDYQNIFSIGDPKDTLATLHKLKGGLRLLQLSNLVTEVTIIEKKINKYISADIQILLTSLINECLAQSNSIIKKLKDDSNK